MKRENEINQVYKFGCRAPREHGLALQLLGQAWLYEDELRRAYNAHKRRERALRAGLAEASHVRAYESYLASQDEVGHVFAFYKDVLWGAHKETLNARIRESRKRRGRLLDWGTYSLIETALACASKDSDTDPIRSQPWEGTGRIGAFVASVEQFDAHPKDVDDEVLWRHKRVQLTRPDARGHALLTIVVSELPRTRKNKPAPTPISITWPIKLHRPFPPDSVIKRVAVQRVRNGHRYRWQAIVTIAREAIERDVDARGVVGVDIGWRMDPEGMRVATHSGEEGVAALHTNTLSAFQYSDAVRGTRDEVFETSKAYVKAAELPGAEHAHLWRDKERLRRLLARTPNLGVAMWNERDKHLEDIECRARSRAIGRRLDAYRTYADQLAKRYRVVALEDMSMSSWVGKGETHARERQRASAALYLLQSTIALRFGPDRVDWVPAQATSLTCSSCEVARSEPLGAASHWTCASCGATHHQDENAALNIRRLCERWIAEGKPVRARTKKAPKKKEKLHADAIATGDQTAMIVTAREPCANAAE